MSLNLRKFNKGVVYRSAPLEIREASDTGAVKGYISVFGEVDSYETSFNRGCFAKSLAERGDKPMLMLFNHDSNIIIGKWNELREDDYGLWGEGQITQRTERGREITGLVEDDILSGLSHGFRTVDYNEKTRSFDEVKIREASLVAFQSCESASLRDCNDITQEELIGILSRETRLPRDQVLDVLSGKKRASAPLQSLKTALADEISNAFTNL